MLGFIAFILLQVNLFPISDTIIPLQNKSQLQKLDTVTVLPDTQTVTIDDIIIVGNNKTKDPIVLRELLLQANTLVNGKEFKELLEKSRNNLFNTGLFNQVSVDYIPVGPNKVKLVIMLTERWYFWPFPIIELADRNINAWWLTKDFKRINLGLYLFKFNFRGKKETISLRAKFGFTQQLGVTYNIPYIDRKQRSGINFGIAYSRNKQLIYKTLNNKILFLRDFENVNRKELSANINYTYRKGIYAYHGFNLRFTSVQISDSIVRISPRYLNFFNTSQQDFFSAEYYYRYDKRNFRAYPTTGYYFEFNASQHGFGILKTEKVNVQYLTLTGKKFFDLGNNRYAGITAKTKLSSNNYQPYYLQRALGYQSDYVRGYEYYVIDGQSFLLTKSNLKYHFIRWHKAPRILSKSIKYNIYANSFADLAYVSDRQFFRENKLNNNWLYGYGLGLDFATTNDLVIRFEVARNALKEIGFYVHFNSPL